MRLTVWVGLSGWTICDGANGPGGGHPRYDRLSGGYATVSGCSDILGHPFRGYRRTREPYHLHRFKWSES